MNPVTKNEKTKRRRMPAAERRAEILNAALEEFSQHGFHETSLEGVAERAGISKALIYEHFSSKSELHEALIDVYLHMLLERLIGAIATSAPPEERLRTGADALLGFVEDHREPWRLIVRDPQEAGVDGPIGRVQTEVGHAIAAMIQADAPADTADPPEEVQFTLELLGQQLVGSLRALANWWDDHREVPRERLVAALMDFAWVGIDRLRQGGQRWQP